jgi:hypothetical protein
LFADSLQQGGKWCGATGGYDHGSLISAETSLDEGRGQGWRTSSEWSESQKSVNSDGTPYTLPLIGTSARSAQTRIHGTTKRQVAAMFAEEQSALGAAVPIPLMQPPLILALALVAALQIELPTDLILTPVSRDCSPFRPSPFERTRVVLYVVGTLRGIFRI